MPPEHKAYPFDYEGFQERLAKRLYAALERDAVADLIAFVEEHRDDLTDPYEGEPLDDDWRDLVDPSDTHQVADVALTAFYDPATSVGLGYDWQRARDLLGEEVVLGTSFGPESNRLDPGKLGSYLQSPEDVERNRKRVAAADLPDDDVVKRAKRMLDEAHRNGPGMYVTF